MRHALLLAVTAIAAPLPAQDSTTATLYGTVSEALSGQPVANARIMVLGTAHTAIAKADGSYEVTGIPPGTHGVRAAFIGYERVEVLDVSLRAGARRQLDFTLAIIDSFTTLPKPGDSIGSPGHAVKMAKAAGWPVLRTDPPGPDHREVRLEYNNNGMAWGPTTFIRIQVGPDTATGSVFHYWWHSADTTGPYQLTHWATDGCAWIHRVDSITTICERETRQVNWRAMADSLEAFGVWQHFTDHGVRRTGSMWTEQDNLSAEASIGGSYRSVSYYAPGRFKDPQTIALLRILAEMRRLEPEEGW